MRAFIAQLVSSTEELCARLERVESDLAAAQKAAVDGVEALKPAEEEKEAICAESERLKEEGKATKAKCKEAELENAQLKKDMEELQFGFMTQKKELEMDYQKQVDEMYFLVTIVI